VLSASERERYARQLLLTEVGVAGQERLCAAQVALPMDASARAADVACSYLERAGVRVEPAAVSGQGPLRVALPDDAAVAALAGDPRLHDAAAWLAGAFAAVEVMKQALGVGTPGALATTLSSVPEAR
jgi:hypothetical protein